MSTVESTESYREPRDFFQRRPCIRFPRISRARVDLCVETLVKLGSLLHS